MDRYQATIKAAGSGAAEADLAELTVTIRANDIDEAEAIAEEVADRLARWYGTLEVDSVA